MAWGKISSVTGAGSGTNLTTGTITASKFNEFNIYTTAFVSGKLRFNNDTGTNYARRYSANGGSDSTANSEKNIGYIPFLYDLAPAFIHGHIFNISTEEKLIMAWTSEANNATGAGTAPNRMEISAKWVNTSDAITEIDIDKTGTNFTTDENFTLLGSDLTPSATIPAIPALVKSLSGTGGWKEIARVTSNDTDVTSIPDKRYLMVLSDHGWNTANAGIGMQINGDTSASQYPRRYSDNGGTDATPTTETNIFYDTMGGGTQTGKRWFMVQHIANKSNKEKLVQYSLCYNKAGLGVNQAPNRIDGVAKWANTSASINRLDLRNFNSGTITSDSEVVVLGWDPDDTHTTNFWEELATASGAGSTLDSGTFTAKKYLWVQCYCKPTSSTNIRLNFNSDTAGNYAIRESVNGGTDATNIQQGNSDSLTGTSDGVLFFNMFIINNAGSEKLWISHGQENSAGSNSAPIPKEVYGKWVNTSDSITKIVATSNFGAGSELKVWGSN